VLRQALGADAYQFYCLIKSDAVKRVFCQNHKPMNKIVASLLICSLLALVVSCSSTHNEYTEWQNTDITQGVGGAVINVDGIDIWTDGTPLQKYRTLGMITISHSRGTFGRVPIVGSVARAWPSSDNDSKLAKLAKAHGGDAVVVIQLGGHQHGENSFGNEGANDFGDNDSSGATASTRHGRHTVALVVKYVN
jgi:hypothetical protein